MRIILLLLILLNGCGIPRESDSPLYTAREYVILLPSIMQMEVDPLGNLYLVDEENRISKFDTSGRLVRHVVYPNLGPVHQIDVGNPFKILAFYRDQQVLVLFDNTLSDIRQIRLTEWGRNDITAAALAPDNSLWLYDGLSKKLIKMQDTGEEILSSEPFDVVRLPAQKPDFIFDAGSLLLLQEKGFPLLIFDDFGHFISSLDIPAEIFAVHGNLILYGDERAIQIYNMATKMAERKIPVNERILDQRIGFYNGAYFTYDKKGVYQISSQ